MNLLKLDIFGSLVWAKRFGSNQQNAVGDILMSSDNEKYVTGFVHPYPTFGDSSFTGLTFDESDIFISKWDVNGNHIKTNILR